MLFLREVKKITFSISYILLVVVITMALFSQGALDFSNDKMEEPQINENYGTKNEENPEIIMPAALVSLAREFSINNYTTYPIGFIKNVKLDDKNQTKIAEIISNITGIDNITVDSKEIQELKVSVRNDISYEEFKDLMAQIDDILGGGSSYAVNTLISYGEVPLTYEKAVEQYNLTKSYDKITGGYARLFSDYASVMVMSILPVFLAVIMSLKDKKNKMADLIYTRKVSGARVVITRYLALVTAVMIPIIVLSYISNASAWKLYAGMQLDYLAPLKYDFGWITPSVMVCVALGMCLTELTNTPIAIAVQGLWWLVDINIGYKSVAASYSLFRLSPRHNAGELSFFRTQDFIDNFNNLVENRLLFVGLSIFIVAITIVIYETKRKGKLNGNYKIKKVITSIRNSKDKLEA